MIRILKMTIFLVLLTVIFVGCNRSLEEVIYDSDYPTYSSIDEIEEYSDLIIRGKIVDSSVELLDVSGPPLTNEELKDEQLNPHPKGERPEKESLELVFTVSNVKIEEIYKGEYDEDVIQIKQGGGELNGVLHIESDVKVLENDQSYILFLQTFDFVPASLLNPYQAAYLYKDGDIQSHHPDNNLSMNSEKQLLAIRAKHIDKK